MSKSPSRNNALRWRAAAGLAVLAVGAIVVVARLNSPAVSNDPDPEPQKEPEAGGAQVRFHKPAAVPVNRTSDVADGFRGEVHPLLNEQAQLQVAAHWTAPAKSRLKLEAPEPVQAWYAGLRPAVPQATYAARDFSAFLPQAMADVGQVWSIDGDRLNQFLRQFHPNASTHLVATGRRAGPDGAFALLRAVSPTHADIVFRVHAEFMISPRDGGQYQSVFAWYTPAYLSGHILINTRTGTVEHFQLALPTEKALNVFLTVNPSLLGIAKLGHDIVRVDRMELVGGKENLSDKLPWTRSISQAEANRRLAKVFYKFEEIDWLPYDQVAAQARSRNRPIFAIVSWGSTDDQSC
jgi:hypothetical protein